MDAEEIYKKSFSRNFGLIKPHEQEFLRNCRVAIPGMGGAGGVHVATLARTGIGKFSIADFDAFDYVNINRQYGAFLSTIGKSKVEVMAQVAKDINPSVEINVFNTAIDESNVDEFLKDVDIVVDALDVFVPEVRRLLFNRARKKGIFVITAGPIGFSAVSVVFSPTGMSLDDLCGYNDDMTHEEYMIRFLALIAGKGSHFKYMEPGKVDPETGAAPSVGLACQLLSGVAATEVINILLNRQPVKAAPWIFQFDPFLHKYRKSYLWGGAKNPLFKLRLSIIKRLMTNKKST